MNHDQSTDAKNEKGETKPVGWLTGTMTGFILIVIGVLVSLTGISLIIGLPLMLAGIAYPFLSRHIIRGRCPDCGNMISTLGSKSAVTCRACGKSIINQNKKLINAE